MSRKNQRAQHDAARPVLQDGLSIPDAHLVKRTRAAKQWRAVSRNENSLLGSFDLGPHRVDLDSRLVRTADGDICLTPMEYCVLKHLAAHRNVPVPHRELAQDLWGVYSGKGVHSLRGFIRSLRKKLEVDPAHPQYIVTVTGVGYCLQS
jgi:two-component system KDP operon response regulator KdpE